MITSISDHEKYYVKVWNSEHFQHTGHVSGVDIQDAASRGYITIETFYEGKRDGLLCIIPWSDVKRIVVFNKVEQNPENRLPKLTPK